MAFLFHVLAILELQTYNKTLKRFFGFHSRRYLAYEMISRRKGGFVGVVSIFRDLVQLLLVTC